MRPSKAGRWQTATILGLADTFLMAGWQPQLQVIARNLLEIGINIGSRKLPFFKAIFIVLSGAQPKPVLRSGFVCEPLLRTTARIQWEDHKPNCAFLNIYQACIHGIEKNTNKCRKQSLCLQVVCHLIGLLETIYNSRLSWRLGILHVHTQLHKMASLELSYEGK